MKLFLIKLGKAIGTIKREGILHGGARVAKSFLSLMALSFQVRKKGDVLFIVGGVGDSSLYRGSNVSEELEMHGFKCAVIVQDAPFLFRFVKNFKVFVFHRTLYTSAIKKMIDEIKKQNKEIVFETDDLVYDPKYLMYMDYYKKMDSFQKKLYENGVGGEILNDPYVKVCTTTTDFLKNKLEGFGKKVFLVRNKINNREFEIARKIVEEKKKKFRSDDIVKIGYFSGTISHNKDFATITDALVMVMKKYGNVELWLAGPLDTENALNEFNARIKRIKFVPREENYRNISEMDINLAPLEIGNPFCEAKSELKFFEAGVVGVPTIASATQTFKDAIEDGIDGFVASSTEEWFEKMEKMVNNPKLREKMGEAAMKKVLEKYTNKNSDSREYYDFLKSAIMK